MALACNAGVTGDSSPPDIEQVADSRPLRPQQAAAFHLQYKCTAGAGDCTSAIGPVICCCDAARIYQARIYGDGLRANKRDRAMSQPYPVAIISPVLTGNGQV